MNTNIIYNPNCIDSFLSASFLLDYGYKVYSNREVLPNEESTNYWLNVVPSSTYYQDGVNKKSINFCYTKGSIDTVPKHLLLKGVFYEIESLDNAHDKGFDDLETYTSFLDKVANFNNIKSPERYLTNDLIKKSLDRYQYYEDASIDNLKLLMALDSLKKKTPSEGNNLVYGSKLDQELIYAIDKRSKMLKAMRDSLSQRTVFRTYGNYRLNISFSNDLFWFMAKSLIKSPTDILINFTMAPCGILVDTTKIVQLELEDFNSKYFMVRI